MSFPSLNGRTRIKMCGTTRLEDALTAVSLGVDALGFIFYQKSPRYIEPEKAQKIVAQLPPFVDCVGVFVNASVEEIEKTQKIVGLSHLQLHGSESTEFCQALQKRLPYCLLLKAFRVSEKSKREDFADYASVVSGFLLDTYVQGEPGGTGKVFDWSIISKFDLSRPLILAGGLHADNIEDALDKAAPYAVDINSGVEAAPGIKDHRKLAETIRKVAEKRESKSVNLR